MYPNPLAPLRRRIVLVYNAGPISDPPNVKLRMVSANPFLPAGHDHRDCVHRALDRAVRVCRERGLRLTASRRRVLELVWQSHCPIGAYDVLHALNSEGRAAAPPTVYRALDFLMEANLVHRLDTLNAYVGCPDPEAPHAGQFLICRSCRSVAELGDNEIEDMLNDKAEQAGFTAVRQMLEIQGLCPTCRDQDAVQ